MSTEPQYLNPPKGGWKGDTPPKVSIGQPKGKGRSIDVPRHNARARHTPGKMNKTESAYAADLDMAKRLSEITHWMYEPLKFRLADQTYYSPDFMVLYPDGLIEFVEVKGHWEDDARVKVKVVAERFPMFRFVGVTRVKGDWKREEF